MVFSSSQYFASYPPYNDPYTYLKTQSIAAAIGLVAMVIAWKMDYRIFRKLTFPAMLVVFALLIFMVVSKEIEERGGAARWLEILGVNFQPSEFVKVMLPLMLANMLAKSQREIRSFTQGFLPSLIFTGVVSGLILLQKDLSSAMVVGATGFILMFCAGVRPAYMGATLLSGVAAVVAAIILEPYRLERLYAWLDPWSDPLDGGYQAIQSLMALGSGGLTGVGLGAGGSKWYYLPSRHTDFIFSVWGEEMGFVGACVLVIIYLFFIWRCMNVAFRSDTMYRGLLALGLTSSITVQAFINLGVVTGLLPVTGVTLPFISYGGTSLCITLLMTGILLNLSQYRR